MCKIILYFGPVFAVLVENGAFHGEGTSVSLALSVPFGQVDTRTYSKLGKTENLRNSKAPIIF